MKYLLLLFSVIIASVAPARAQKIRFGDTANRWTVTRYNFSTPPVTPSEQGIYRLHGDTMIGGRRFRFLICDAGFELPPIAVWDDTAARRVICYYRSGISSASWPQDTVLYDYNLVPGDTVTRRTFYKTTKFYVAVIDSTFINGIKHRIWNMKRAAGSGSTTTTSQYAVIEGIGSTCNPWFPLFPYTFENAWRLNCFSDAAGKPALSKAADNFDNNTSCTLGINSISCAANTLFIIPNPATGNTINITGLTPGSTLAVYHMSGSRMISETISSGTLELDIQALPAGIYNVVSSGKNGSVQSARFVRQ